MVSLWTCDSIGCCLCCRKKKLVIRWFHFTWLMIFRSRFCVFIGVWPLHIFHCRHIFNSFHTTTRQTPEEILLPWLTSRYASSLVLKCTVQNSTWDGCGCFNLFVYHHLIGYRHHLIYLCTKQAHRANDGLDIAFRLLDPSRSSSPPYPTLISTRLDTCWDCAFNHTFPSVP